MANKVVHAAERKVFEVILKSIVKKARNSRNEGYIQFVDAAEKWIGDTWPAGAFDKLRETFGKNGKWAQFFDRLLDEVDVDYLRGLIMAFGFEAGFAGFKEVKKNREKYGCGIPWVILFDPTSACNLKCTGCWAAEYGHTQALTWEEMDGIVTQGKALGIHAYVMTGGEPMVRKKDIIRLCEKHKDCGFLVFTNGTLVDQQFCDDMRRVKNITLSMSIEGFDEATDARRGKGTFQKVMDAMDLLRKNGLVYGTSICYTSQNYKAVTSDEFYDFLISKGVTFSWYFHYMPVGNDAAPELLLTPEQREYMYHRIREVRDFTGGKQIFTIDFQNDGEMVGGCIAGGKNYCHINPNGDVEPCVFIHYSNANIREKSLLECLQQPLFKEYQAAQPFNKNMLQPCPMLENPEILQEIVRKSGAHSTDMQSPETAEHLCSKCVNYAQEWGPVAKKLWENSKRGKKQLEEDAKAAEANK